MSLGTVIWWLFLTHLYLHLGVMLALYLLPVHLFEVGRGYRFWPPDWPSRIQALAFVVLEYWAFYFFILTYPLGWVVPRRLVLTPHPDPKDPRNVPVVLVHGYMMNRFCMVPLQLYLAWKGFRHVETLSLRHLQGPVEAFALQLRRRLAELEQEAPGRGAHLVGHSMGGLVSALTLTDKVAAQRVRGIIAMGSPFGGTLLYRGGVGICARQFRPGGVFTRRVITQFAEGDAARMVSIYSEGDRIVIPPHSAHVEGATSNQRLRFLGHMSLLLSPSVFRLVRDTLSSRKLAGSDDVLVEGARG